MTVEPRTHQGLAGQIKYIEENNAIKKKLGKDTSFGEGLIKEWRKYLPGGSKHHLWLAYSKEGSHQGKPKPLS